MTTGKRKYASRRKRRTFNTEKQEVRLNGWYTLRDCAKEIGVHETTIRNWHRSGRLKTVKQSEFRGNAVYVSIEESMQVKKFMAQNYFTYKKDKS